MKKNYTLAVLILAATHLWACSKREAAGLAKEAAKEGEASVEQVASIRSSSAEELADLNNSMKIYETVVQRDLGYKFKIKSKITKKEKKKFHEVSLDVSRAKIFYSYVRKNDHQAKTLVSDHIKCIGEYIKAAEEVVQKDLSNKDLKIIEAKIALSKELLVRLQALEERVSKDKNPSPFVKAPNVVNVL